MTDQFRHEAFDKAEEETTVCWWIDVSAGKMEIEVTKVSDLVSDDFRHLFFWNEFGLSIRLWDETSPEEVKNQLQAVLTWVDEGGLDSILDHG